MVMGIMDMFNAVDLDSEKKYDPMKSHRAMLEATLNSVKGVMSAMAERSLSGKMKELEKEFKEKINRIIENEKEKEGNYPEEFYQQIVCLAEDMWECIKDFIEKSVEKYDGKEILDGHDYIQDIDINDYGSYSYDYERLSQAKVACKEAVKKAVSDARRNFAEGKAGVAELCSQFLDEMDSDIRSFLQKYSSSYDDYVSLDCEEEAESFAQKQKNSIVDVEKAYNGLDARQALDSLMEELFDSAFAEKINVKKYFEECEYSEDDEFYCYDAEEVLKSLNGDTRDLFETACEELEGDIVDLYSSILYSLASKLSEKLGELVQTDV